MRHTMTATITALLLAIAAFATPATASDYAFKLHNRSDGWTISGFYTYQDGTWSSNWLDTNIESGQSVRMDWNSNAGNCVVPFRVRWVDYGSEDFKVDWCKGVSNIYMKNKGFSWD
jgi:hypothetical protein